MGVEVRGQIRSAISMNLILACQLLISARKTMQQRNGLKRGRVEE